MYENHPLVLVRYPYDPLFAPRFLTFTSSDNLSINPAGSGISFPVKGLVSLIDCPPVTDSNYRRTAVCLYI